MATQLLSRTQQEQNRLPETPTDVCENISNQTDRGVHLQQFNDRMDEYAAKLEYQQKLQQEIDRLNTHIDEFFGQLSDSAQIYLSPEHQELLEQLMVQRDALLEKRNELEQASLEAWQDLQGGLDRSLSELTQSFEKALARFSHLLGIAN